MSHRRLNEAHLPYFVDRFSTKAWILSLLLIVLSMVDAVATLILLGRGCEEINPVMSFFLGHGNQVFLLGKLFLTSAALPILLVFQNHYMFGTKLRVSYVLPTLVALFGTLNIYQLVLFGQV